MQASLPVAMPQHVAIIMDGNRRRAAKRSMPCALGHANGVRRVRQLIESCSARGVCLKLIGDLSRFDQRLQNLMASGQALTANNSKLTLTIAANYGGRWDMMQAVQAWQAANPAQSVASMDEAALRPHLSMGYAPDPDLLIRTGGESRISNFMLWQMAYTELFFTDTLWPDFSAQSLDNALQWYQARDRRFGASRAPAPEIIRCAN